MPVLDEESGKILKWHQLLNHPRLKEVCKKLYTKELRSLCQDTGHGKYVPKKQLVAGLDTFFVIKREKIPVGRRKEISLSKVICEVWP